jgi:hypothetical protein
MRKINTSSSPRLDVVKFAILSLLLTSATAFAESPADRADTASERASSTQPAGRYEMARRKMAGKPPAATAQTDRVYLEDYERLPQTVTRQYPTKAYWLGQKDKARKSDR